MKYLKNFDVLKSVDFKVVRKLLESSELLPQEVSYAEAVKFSKNKKVLDFNRSEIDKISLTLEIEPIFMRIHDPRGNNIGGDLQNYNKDIYKRVHIALSCKKISSKFYPGKFNSEKSESGKNLFDFGIYFTKFDDEFYLIVFRIMANHRVHEMKYFIADQFNELEGWVYKFREFYLSDKIEFSI